MSVDDTLKNVLSQILKIPCEEVREDLTMKDVSSWDSLTHLNLILSIEEAFQVKFPMNMFPELTSFPKIKSELGKILSRK